MGTLKQEGKIEAKSYRLERGVYSFPSIGDTVILPTDIQLKSIVENKEENSVVKIGVAPIAGNAEVKINCSLSSVLRGEGWGEGPGAALTVAMDWSFLRSRFLARHRPAYCQRG